MGGEVLILLELLLIVGVVFGFGLWQLRALKRPRRSEESEAEDDDRPPGRE